MTHNNLQSTFVARPPVVAIMGHVDHGKSTLLDTLRHTNVVAGEAGGITQHVAAYEVVHKNSEGEHKITFIDTPGHAAFTGIRERSANIADIAVLIVAADDGVKAQTLEALHTIQNNNVPFLVAINKIDKPNADVEKIKRELAEHGLFLEGFGGTVSFVAISAKTGKNLDELLETILLLAEINEYKANSANLATGFVIESHRDPQRGVAATLLIKDGSLKKGQFVVTGNSMTSCRILENFKGEAIDSATFSSPIQIVGFSKECPVGAPFTAFNTKADAEKAIENLQDFCLLDDFAAAEGQEINVIPVIVKCDVVGSIDAVISEIHKCNTSSIYFKVIKSAVGDINDSDIQLASTDSKSIVIGFHVDIDSKIKDAPETRNMTIKTFTIIYKMTEWLEEASEDLKFKKKVDTELGVLTIMKVFSADKGNYLVGGKVTTGVLTVKDKVKCVVSGDKKGIGTILSIQVGKTPSQKVTAGDECGIMIELSSTPVEHSELVAYQIDII